MSDIPILQIFITYILITITIYIIVRQKIKNKEDDIKLEHIQRKIVRSMDRTFDNINIMLNSFEFKYYNFRKKGNRTKLCACGSGKKNIFCCRNK